MMAVVGDDTIGLIVDRTSKRHVAELVGHKDYSFAVAWKPGERVVATGNQDLTTRIWDLRYSSEPVAILRGEIGAIRSLRSLFHL